MGRADRTVEEFFAQETRWPQELRALRSILRDTPLTEESKWGQPCYTFAGANLAMIAGFKDNFVVSFFKGALLADTAGVLTRPGDNSQSARMIRFTDLEQIAPMAPIIRAYVDEAIAAEQAGLKVVFNDSRNLDLPEELTARLNADPALKAAFEALTPGRQRSHYLHITGAKQPATRAARAEKCVPKILAGKGFLDR